MALPTSSPEWRVTRVEPSPGALAALWVGTALLVVAVLVAPASVWLRLAGVLWVGVAAMHTHRWLRRQRGVLRVASDGSASFDTASGQLSKQLRVLPWLITLAIRTQDGRQRRLWLTADMVGTHQHRRLRSHLLALRRG